jgi:hypothetical protein
VGCGRIAPSTTTRPSPTFSVPIEVLSRAVPSPPAVPPGGSAVATVVPPRSSHAARSTVQIGAEFCVPETSHVESGLHGQYWSRSMSSG